MILKAVPAAATVTGLVWVEETKTLLDRLFYFSILLTINPLLLSYHFIYLFSRPKPTRRVIVKCDCVDVLCRYR